LVLTLTPARLTLVGPGATPGRRCAAGRRPERAAGLRGRAAVRSAALRCRCCFRERERDHILRGEIEIAGADQRIEPRCIGEVNRGHRPCLIGMGHPAEAARCGIDSDGALLSIGRAADQAGGENEGETGKTTLHNIIHWVLLKDVSKQKNTRMSGFRFAFFAARAGW
jgi:hypothetical protein